MAVVRGIGRHRSRSGFALLQVLAPQHAATDLRREYGLVPPYGPDFEAMMAAQITP